MLGLVTDSSNEGMGVGRQRYSTLATCRGCTVMLHYSFIATMITMSPRLRQAKSSEWDCNYKWIIGLTGKLYLIFHGDSEWLARRMLLIGQRKRSKRIGRAGCCGGLRGYESQQKHKYQKTIR